MAKTHAHRLSEIASAAALRQRRRRARMQDIGRPDTVPTDYAIVEAIAFLIARSGVSTLRADEDASAKGLAKQVQIPLRDLKNTALDILVRREGYDRDEAKIALKQRLGMRQLHVEPWHIPSLQPDPEAQQERVNAAALERAKEDRAAA